MDTKKFLGKLRDGMTVGLGVCLTVGAVSGAYATYATLTASPSETLTKDKWNEMLQYTVPPGAVMAFNLASCPTGWSAADGGGSPARPDLRGEFVRGLDSWRGVDGSRWLATSQSWTSFPSLYVYAWSSTSWVLVSHPVSANAGYPNDAMAMNMDSTKVGTSGVYMTTPLSPSGASSLVNFTARPRNVALLYCVKN